MARWFITEEAARRLDEARAQQRELPSHWRPGQIVYVRGRCTQCGSRGMERYCPRATCRMKTPNRLYGTILTDEGDAI